MTKPLNPDDSILPLWAEPAALLTAEQRRELAASDADTTDWCSLSEMLTEREQEMFGQSAHSDAEFIISLRSGIARSREFVPALLSSSRRFVGSLSGLGFALSALLLVLGRYESAPLSPPPPDIETAPSAYIVLDDVSSYLNMSELDATGAAIIPESLAADLGVSAVLEAIEPQAAEVTTTDLLALDELSLIAVLDEFQSTRFF
jgi:hypothetical protein